MFDIKFYNSKSLFQQIHSVKFFLFFRCKVRHKVDVYNFCKLLSTSRLLVLGSESNNKNSKHNTIYVSNNSYGIHINISIEREICCIASFKVQLSIRYIYFTAPQYFVCKKIDKKQTEIWRCYIELLLQNFNKFHDNK